MLFSFCFFSPRAKLRGSESYCEKIIITITIGQVNSHVDGDGGGRGRRGGDNNNPLTYIQTADDERVPLRQPLAVTV